jgi:hypothetical protein
MPQFTNDDRVSGLISAFDRAFRRNSPGLQSRFRKLSRMGYKLKPSRKYGNDVASIDNHA